MAYMAETYPQQRLHVSVQASASNREAIRFLVYAFGPARRFSAHPHRQDIARLIRQIDCEVEVFTFGGLCVMAEGRCSLCPEYSGSASCSIHNLRRRQSPTCGIEVTTVADLT